MEAKDHDPSLDEMDITAALLCDDVGRVVWPFHRDGRTRRAK